MAWQRFVYGVERSEGAMHYTPFIELFPVTQQGVSFYNDCNVFLSSTQL